ncbi:phage tail assembly chaperone [Pseudomonas sp. RIT288]|uniref:phage tail assembly chaperone n=1 Tax=Pseudomonas sp. RIT288 TaxID=1470589 RepID=UPI00044ECF9F|nr:tail assembly chaperone [Pseudomonas sp. RIT288]EZP27194.1 Caudovirales tail fiber assembly protein [Pseudomonas sp. RIT288]
MKYIHFDAQGELLGRYDSAIHLQIPAGAVEISDELFLRTIDERDGIWRYTDGKVTKHSLPNASQVVDGERRATALARRDELLAEADQQTVGMADAYIAGLLDADDMQRFKAFATYKLALNKIDKQPGYPQNVVWPVLPA